MNKPAFTLIEMIIAITVFTIFIGFSMTSYLGFHRVQQEAATTRSLIMETQSVLDMISQAIKENRIDYTRYFGAFGDFKMISSSSLHLLSADGQKRIMYNFYEEELTYQEMDLGGVPKDGFWDPIVLNGKNTRVDHVNFSIFPSMNPYDTASAKDDDLQYQPFVELDMTFAVPGRVRDEVFLDVHTSVTSRFYQ
jgi:prepilin-type N-terminal cleavage/methylation domain-containing protein